MKDVVENLAAHKDIFGDNLTVFDNNSTVDWVAPLLTQTFDSVYVSNVNVGYWSAIDWWLNTVPQDDFTYIIESDMIHYGMNKLGTCENFLKENEDVGSVRLHQYSIADQHLYDKSRPVPRSKKNIWQSHTNRVTNERVTHELAHDDGTVQIYTNNFLTQLPALNRTKAIKEIFAHLSTLKSFSEFDYQKMYWDQYQKTSIVDGGIFHCDAGSYGKKVITGSWTSAPELQRIGYKTTRIANIAAKDSYVVTCTSSLSD